MLVRSERVLALLDARKQRFYAQFFDTTGPLPSPLGGPVDAPLSEILSGPPCVVVGEGGSPAEVEIVQWGGTLGPAESPAEQVGLIALGRPEAAIEPAEIALRYLRPADAKPQVQPA